MAECNNEYSMEVYECTWSNQLEENSFEFCIFSDGVSEITVNLTAEYEYNPHPDYEPRYYWDMELQRYNSSLGYWETIGTREGWVNQFSPSERTFTNVLTGDELIRCVANFRNCEQTGHYGSINTPSIVHNL